MPLCVGILLSNIDEDIRIAAKRGIALVLPIMGFVLGANIDFYKIVEGGFGGVILFIIVIVVTGPVAFIVDRVLLKRPGYGGMATVQIAGAAILSAIFCPFIVQRFAKRFGCPQYEKNFGENPKELVE